MRISKYTLGSDPELFIINSKTGKVVSSVGLIPGVKDDPYKADDMPDGFGIEIDNILAEFNIPPCYSLQEWITNIEYMKNYIREFVKRINPDYDIKCSAYEEVDADQLQSEEAQLFGCDPDYNAYTLRTNPKPEAAGKNGRSCGMHIHFGYENHNVQDSVRLIKYFDVYLGLVSLLYDSDKRRRSLYGRAGCFRLQPWGFEYRSLSGAMMANKDLLTLIYNQVKSAVMAYNRNLSIPEMTLTQTAINNSDVTLAKRLLNDYNISVWSPSIIDDTTSPTLFGADVTATTANMAWEDFMDIAVHRV